MYYIDASHIGFLPVDPHYTSSHKLKNSHLYASVYACRATALANALYLDILL